MMESPNTFLHIPHPHTNLTFALEKIALPLVPLEHFLPTAVQTKDAFAWTCRGDD